MTPVRAPVVASARTVLAAALLAATAVLAPGAAAVPAPPAPPGSEQLTEDLARLRAEVQAREIAAEVAVEAYNEVSAALDGLVLQELAAQATLDDAAGRLDSDRGSAERRVRALYRSGGRPELAWAVWQSGDLGQISTTRRSLAAVLQTDADVISSAQVVADEAVTSSGQVQELRRSRAALQEEADLRRQEAEQALRSSQALLAATDSALVEALAREREAAEQAALAAALQASADALARAQAASSDGGPGNRVGPGGGIVRTPATSADTAGAVQRAVAAAPTPQAAAAIRHAASRLGLPYTWGATGPNTFDCSGLTQWAYRQAGVSIPRTSRQQYAGLRRVPVSELAAGDLLFYANGSDPGSIHHVGMYLGDGMMLHAPRTGDVVKVAALWRTPVYGAVRPVG